MATPVSILTLPHRDRLDEVLVFTDRDQLMKYMDRHVFGTKRKYTLQTGVLDPDPDTGQTSMFR